MAWEENPRICLHMQLIAILSRTGVKRYIFVVYKRQSSAGKKLSTDATIDYVDYMAYNLLYT